MNSTLSDSEAKALRAIRNLVAHGGRFPSVRELMKELDFSSPRSAAWLIERLLEKGCLKRGRDRSLQLAPEPKGVACALTVDIPIVGTANCGCLLLAEENIEGTLSVSTRLASPPYQYFILRAAGDSMNQKGIEPGNFVLVRQQTIAKDGDDVVALVDDEATIKELHTSDAAIILKPASSNKKHKPIILARDFQIQGVVVASFPDPTQFQEAERSIERR